VEEAVEGAPHIRPRVEDVEELALTPSPVIATIRLAALQRLDYPQLVSGPPRPGPAAQLGIGTATLFRKLKRYEHAG